MAEPASSIITIVALSLKVLRETYTYIKGIRSVNDLVISLLNEITDLTGLVEIIESTYLRADLGKNRDAANLVGRTLNTCQKRLAPIKELVIELAAQESETWLQKIMLKGKSDCAKEQIEQAMRDMDRDMEKIRTGLSLWTLELASSSPRSSKSEAQCAQQLRSASPSIEQGHDAPIYPRKRSLSDTNTLYNLDPPWEVPLVATLSGSSVSSTFSGSLDTESADGGSITSENSPVSSHETYDWKSFHTALMKYPIPRIRTLLEQQQGLATMVGDCQRTPLHIAAQLGKVELARLLLEFGADKNAHDSQPSTVLDLAVEYNQRDFVAFLIDQGVDEETLSENHKERFRETKSVMRLKKEMGSHLPKNPKRDGRKLSWPVRRGKSI